MDGGGRFLVTGYIHIMVQAEKDKRREKKEAERGTDRQRQSTNKKNNSERWKSRAQRGKEHRKPRRDAQTGIQETKTTLGYGAQ